MDFKNDVNRKSTTDFNKKESYSQKIILLIYYLSLDKKNKIICFEVSDTYHLEYELIKINKFKDDFLNFTKVLIVLTRFVFPNLELPCI